LKGAKEEAVSRLPKIEVKEKPKKTKISEKKKSQTPEQSVPAQSEPEQLSPDLETTQSPESAQIISIDDFKKRMLVKTVGQ